jgi:hypothetical protein
VLSELWIPLLVALITVTGGIVTWSFTERARRAQEEFARREARYSVLVSAIHGFYEDTTSPELRAKFIAELELAWLYCPDDVIRKGYRFLNSVHVGSQASEVEQKAALGEFVVAIRQDLLSRKRVKVTNLKPSEFQTLGPTLPGRPK